MGSPAEAETASAKALRHGRLGRRQRGYSTGREETPAEPEALVGMRILSKSSDQHGRILRMILPGLLKSVSGRESLEVAVRVRAGVESGAS